MYIESLRLRNYRNYDNEIIQLKKGMNVVLGDNGEGKTNLLESIYLLSTTRSHRNDEDKDLVKFGQEFSSVEGISVNNSGKEKIGVVIHGSGKTLLINSQPVRRNSEMIGRINAVLFAPTDMDLFDASPKTRRRVVDLEIGKLSVIYMYSLSNYLKSLKERNNYLKGNVDRIMLETLTEMLYEPEIRIIRERNEFINDINSYLSYFYNQISGENHKVEIEYRSIIQEKEDESLMREQLKNCYANLEERDIYLKQTNTGIHREDYCFYLDDKEVSRFCSQGQKRMVILAFKMSIVQIIYQKKREYPILLLDDVFSELDNKRKMCLLKLLPDSIQTVITTTDINEVEVLKNQNISIINVRKGIINYGK
ncbi:MAG: DNA replication/repair protein RecF [Erysipelotrichaceae bacterium]|nr:DNA replication/repair protein RecF [Erysipelotrichaceae bacterium]